MFASLILLAALNVTGPHFINEYTLPLGAYPQYIVSGPDGALWFDTFPYFTNIAPIDLGSGLITTARGISFPPFETGRYDLPVGAGGNLWVTERSRAPCPVRRLTMQGERTQLHVRSGGSRE